MSVRVQVILDEAERDELKRLARKEGVSLSAWLREAGRARAAEATKKVVFESAADLDRFFASCDERESGREPDWEDHLRMIETSRSRGRAQAE